MTKQKKDVSLVDPFLSTYVLSKASLYRLLDYLYHNNYIGQDVHVMWKMVVDQDLLDDDAVKDAFHFFGDSSVSVEVVNKASRMIIVYDALDVKLENIKTDVLLILGQNVSKICLDNVYVNENLTILTPTAELSLKNQITSFRSAQLVAKTITVPVANTTLQSSLGMPFLLATEELRTPHGLTLGDSVTLDGVQYIIDPKYDQPDYELAARHAMMSGARLYDMYFVEPKITTIMEKMPASTTPSCIDMEDKEIRGPDASNDDIAQETAIFLGGGMPSQDDFSSDEDPQPTLATGDVHTETAQDNDTVEIH